MSAEQEYQRFLVVVAHPDDAEFSCAGTVARWIREGRQGFYVLCTSGNKGSSDPEMTSERLAAIREAEQLEASRVLGVSETIFLRFPDNELHCYPHELREAITRQIRRLQPDIVITHDPWRPYSFHSDHRTVGLTTVDSIYPTARDRLNFPEHEREGLLPWKVAQVYLYGAAEPDTWVDTSETFDLKIEALRKHVCQVGGRDDLAERMRERAREVGQAANLPMAEAFKVLRLTR
jgi:LmbE family N-acetylglucosaminyl deacetylase